MSLEGWISLHSTAHTKNVSYTYLRNVAYLSFNNCILLLCISCIIIYETVDWYFSFFDNAKSEWMNVLIYINFYFWLHASISLVAASEISIFKHHHATPATDKKEEKILLNEIYHVRSENCCKHFPCISTRSIFFCINQHTMYNKEALFL